jgi:hypothetical protein
MARQPNTTTKGKPFDEATIEAVWKMGTPEPELPSLRKDICGARMERSKYGRIEKYGWEIDHIEPVAQGGTDSLDNLQPLQWENNREKADDYPDWYCKNRS